MRGQALSLSLIFNGGKLNNRAHFLLIATKQQGARPWSSLLVSNRQKTELHYGKPLILQT